ncbi:ABC transporter ATP-binding protein [Spirochaetia bacterium]|nr:ABC transporter ATP-binding protein [Spirochaetia bacterium]
MGQQNLEISHLNKTFELKEGPLQVLQDISLCVKQQEFVSIVGISGCGKSTLLRIIAGLETYEDGLILNDGKEIHAPGYDRGMIFQESRLFPWLVVEDNVAFGIGKENQKRLSKKEKQELVRQYLELVGLEQFAKAYPYQLSGGMQQRVSIVRALIEEPEILLLDEPFGALDALTRIHMQHEVLRIWEHKRMTMLLVTHDIDEAIYLGDRVIIMSARPGTIKREIAVDLPRPRNRSSEGFIRIRKSILQEFFEDQSVVEDFAI